MGWLKIIFRIVRFQAADPCFWLFERSILIFWGVFVTCFSCPRSSRCRSRGVEGLLRTAAAIERAGLLLIRVIQQTDGLTAARSLAVGFTPRGLPPRRFSPPAASRKEVSAPKRDGEINETSCFGKVRRLESQHSEFCNEGSHLLKKSVPSYCQ